MLYQFRDKSWAGSRHNHAKLIFVGEVITNSRLGANGGELTHKM
jgi:hypothetical protein